MDKNSFSHLAHDMAEMSRQILEQLEGQRQLFQNVHQIILPKNYIGSLFTRATEFLIKYCILIYRCTNL